MSFDKGAFRSYGWEQNANSPVSADRAMAYVLALNDLLKPGSEHRKDIAGMAFLYWLKSESPLDPVALIDEDPTPELLATVTAVLELNKSAWLSEDERNEVYMAAVSATGSRLVLRSWLTELLPVAIENLIAWWEGLQIQPLDRYADGPRSEPFWKLLYALHREGQPPASRVVALRQRALEGLRKPLGYRVLGDVLARLRVDSDKRRDIAALGLLRLCLNDLYDTTGKGEPMPPALDEDNPNTHSAYVCGRLLAIYDEIQYRTFSAAGESQPNVTVSDRFYSLTMNSPAIGLARASELGKKHLQKLRRYRGQKAEDWYNGLLGAVGAPLNGEPPKPFDLHDKARFALGFYHQKAYRPARSADPDQVDNPDPTPTFNPTLEEIQQ
jgi:CRISPR-associated protein Csd1